MITESHPSNFFLTQVQQPSHILVECDMNDSLLYSTHHDGVRADTNRGSSAEMTEIQCRISTAVQDQDFPSKLSDDQCALGNCPISSGHPPTATCLNSESTTAPPEVIGDNASKESSIETVTM